MVFPDHTHLLFLVVVWGGLGLTWQVDVIKMLLNLFFKFLYYHKNNLWVFRMWLGMVWRWFGVFWGVFGGVSMWVVAALKSLPALSFNALIFPILRIVCTISFHYSCPGSGVVLDCVDS